MIGVIVNVITVILGSGVGLLFQKGIPDRVSQAAMIDLGACTLYIGISGSLCGENPLILIGSVVLGAINEMTCAGSLLIIMIGTNLMGITKIKVADFLPAIVFAPVIYQLLPVFEKLYGIFVG